MALALGAGLLLAIALSGTGPGVAPAAAQGVSPDVDPALKAEFDAAFQDMLHDPANLDKTFKYAELAVKVGDFEAAITALERMLLFNPDLPRVRLELGVLYFRLGSYAIARTYLTRALEAPDVPADVRERVQVYLAEIDKRLSPHQFAGSVYGGYRYQSNANSGPSTAGVKLFGFPATLSPDSVAHSDSNIFYSGNFRYVYDEQAQNGEVLEAGGTLYGTRQFSQQQLNLIFFEGTVGPRVPFPTDVIDQLSIHPYLLFDFVGLEEARYYSAFGGGLQLDKGWTDRLATNLLFEFKSRDFNNTTRRPFNAQQDGQTEEARLTQRFLLTPDDVFTGYVSVMWQHSTNGIYSNREWLGSLSYAKTYDAPFDLGADRWTSSLTGSFGARRYFLTDITIDPSNVRFDREKRIGLITAIPVTKDISVVLDLERAVVISSELLYTYNDTSASIGASWKF